MATLFYEDRFERRLPLTGLFIECFGKEVAEIDNPSGADIVRVISETLIKCGLVEGEPSEEDVVYVVERMNLLAADGEVKGKGADAPNGKGKFFAGYFMEWASGLEFHALCLYAAGYDYEKARRLYEEVDHKSLIAIAHEKLQFDFERARVALEASLFGFGGGYKDTPKSDDSSNVIDLTGDSPEADRILKSMCKGIF